MTPLLLTAPCTLTLAFPEQQALFWMGASVLQLEKKKSKTKGHKEYEKKAF